jgi:hypothetical protein
MGWDFGPLGWGKKQLGKKIVLMRVAILDQDAVGRWDVGSEVVVFSISMWA